MQYNFDLTIALRMYYPYLYLFGEVMIPKMKQMKKNNLHRDTW